MIIKGISGPLDAGGGGTTPTTTTTSTSTTTLAPGNLPRLEGFGAAATGGTGFPTVYHVTNTNASGAGSLLNGLGSDRTIVFDVSGTINQRHDITSISNLTIDGTTAPYPGIVITTNQGDGMSVGTRCVNIIIKGLTFINCTGDGLNVIGDEDGLDAHIVAIMHCFAYGNQDGNIDIASSAYNVTMQFCIIGNHDASQNNDGGTLVTGHFASVHHNLFYPKSPNPGSGEREPLVHRNYGVPSTPDADVRNNIMWKWGRSNGTGSGFGIYSAYGAKVNAVANYCYTAGAATADGVTRTAYQSGGIPPGDLYAAGNVSGNGVNLNANGNMPSEYSIPVQYQITGESACAAALRVLQYAGPTQRNPVGGTREPIAAGYINDITPLTGCP